MDDKRYIVATCGSVFAFQFNMMITLLIKNGQFEVARMGKDLSSLKCSSNLTLTSDTKY